MEKFFVVIFLFILVMSFKMVIIYALLCFFRDVKIVIKIVFFLA